jgi:NAD-dependent SIR2 family protein deacetylase
MGVDSGLPDFRGDSGFWNNYPPYKGKFNFYDCANPNFLKTNPELFWGFYGHRLQMYRQKQPHAGHSYLLNIAKTKKDFFTFTTNVDGHFTKVFGADKVYEVHGSIHYLQCPKCEFDIVPNEFKP